MESVYFSKIYTRCRLWEQSTWKYGPPIVLPNDQSRYIIRVVASSKEPPRGPAAHRPGRAAVARPSPPPQPTPPDPRWRLPLKQLMAFNMSPRLSEIAHNKCDHLPAGLGRPARRVVGRVKLFPVFPPKPNFLQLILSFKPKKTRSWLEWRESSAIFVGESYLLRKGQKILPARNYNLT